LQSKINYERGLFLKSFCALAFGASRARLAVATYKADMSGKGGL
jgi:hypothetical protein